MKAVPERKVIEDSVAYSVFDIPFGLYFKFWMEGSFLMKSREALKNCICLGIENRGEYVK